VAASLRRLRYFDKPLPLQITISFSVIATTVRQGSSFHYLKESIANIEDSAEGSVL